MDCIVWARAPRALSCNPVIVTTYIYLKRSDLFIRRLLCGVQWMVHLLFPSYRQPQHWKLAWGQSQKETAYQNTGVCCVLIDVDQAVAGTSC